MSDASSVGFAHFWSQATSRRKQILVDPKTARLLPGCGSIRPGKGWRMNSYILAERPICAGDLFVSGCYPYQGNARLAPVPSVAVGLFPSPRPASERTRPAFGAPVIAAPGQRSGLAPDGAGRDLAADVGDIACRKAF